MNKNAEKHLAKAKDYLAKGDEFYRKAKPEIEAAFVAGANYVEISRYLEKSKSWVYDVRNWDGSGTLYGKDTERRQVDQAKQVLRESDPEQIAAILEDPEIRRNVTKAQDLRHTEQKQRSESAYREAIGPATADGLDKQQALTDAEAELFKSRRALRDTLAMLRAIDPSEFRDSWLEEFVKTFDDIVAMCQLGRSLVDGESVDEAIDRILAGGQ